MKVELQVDTHLICQEMGVSRSGYYSWLNRPESNQKTENKMLIEKVKEIHKESKGTYGLLRVLMSLKDLGHSCGKSRVHKLMKNAEISGIIKKRYKIRTTDSNHSDPIAPRIFQTEEPATHPTKPNQLWASDISYVPTLEGFLYLATYLDIFTRKVVGFSMSESLETSLILDALEIALGREKASEVGLTSHSDRRV